MKYVYVIVFDPKGFRRIIGNVVYESEHDAESMLKALINDHPDVYNFDDYAVECLKVR